MLLDKRICILVSDEADGTDKDIYEEFRTSVDHIELVERVDDLRTRWKFVEVAHYQLVPVKVSD